MGTVPVVGGEGTMTSQKLYNDGRGLLLAAAAWLLQAAASFEVGCTCGCLS